MPTYNHGNDQLVGICPNGHIPSDSSSGWRAAWFRATVRRLGRALEAVEPARAAVALSTRATALILAALLSACGGGSGTPTAPSPPVSTPAPSPPPTPAPAARLAVSGPISFLVCIGGLCSFEGSIKNEGNACAVNVSGETWIMSAQGQEVGRARWQLPAAAMIRPGEEVRYFGADMPQIVLNHLDGRYFASFSFESRSC